MNQVQYKSRKFNLSKDQTLKKRPIYRILGVDPGTNILGYAIIEVNKQQLTLIDMGVLNMASLSQHQLKLKKIFEGLQEIILRYGPTEMAIEAPFYGKNVQSMLKLGRAQGVAIAAGITNDVPVVEYAPKKIKQSVTGSGNASKEQVAAMLNTILKTKLDRQSLDATDALATAVCHFYQSSNPLSGTKKYSNWADFAKENDKRIKGK